MFHQENLSIEIDSSIDEQCETIKIDSRFLSDINSVIHGDISEDVMTLGLNNNNGAMHFVRKIEEEIK